jgi:hypothetical protein
MSVSVFFDFYGVIQLRDRTYIRGENHTRCNSHAIILSFRNCASVRDMLDVTGSMDL